MTSPLLQVDGLDISFTTPDGLVRAVRNLSFEVGAGETLGLVGESGSGKSQTVLATMGLLADNGMATGEVRFDGHDILNLPAAEINRIRGRRIAMIFQDPMTSLNPFLTIGRQMSEVLRFHQGLDRKAALKQCERMLDAVHIADSKRRLAMYPHELSGGMRQRVMIATALLCRPALLIADEPTTALDVTVQAQILTLMKELRSEFETSIILITHDLGVVAGLCDRVLVMQDGEAKDYGPTDQVFYAPEHTYTKALLAAVPRLDDPKVRGKFDAHLSNEGSKEGRRDQPIPAVLTVDELKVNFTVPSARLFGVDQTLHAVDGISLALKAGETLGVVGESGCGKSTLARAVLQLVPVTEGRVCLLGQDLGDLDRRSLKKSRRNMQVIFQDPLAALNPRMTVAQILAEPLQTFYPDSSKTDVLERGQAILEKVGLEKAHMNRYPHEFSGGQCQRIGIARALILQPRLIVCDEPVSALDVSIQAQIVELLVELQEQLGIALIFIAHDLAVVRQISHRIMVMYLGRVVEVADQHDLFARPQHPYTRALINAIPVPDPRAERARAATVLEGDVPSPLNPPSGCAFRTRCAHATRRCAETAPRLEILGNSAVACHHAGDL
jgi:oligopeptide/dipeptide ABC transporter ATP-binding protein